MGYNMFAYCNNNPVCYADYSGNVLIEITLTTAGTVAAVAVCGIVIIHFVSMALCTLLDWLADQWFYLYAQISFIYEQDDEPCTEYADVSASYIAPDPFDDDDDYYEDDSNFGGKQKGGKRKGNAPQSNQKQNADFDRAANELNLNFKQREILHRRISGRGLGYYAIIEAAKALFMILAD